MALTTEIMNRSEINLEEISRIFTTGEEIGPWDLLFHITPIQVRDPYEKTLGPSWAW